MLLYHKAIEEAIEYIEKHLKEPIKVEQVTKFVNVSYFHFHRIFFAVTGEMLGDYIRKRRLTQAACELLSTNERIINIALDYQFESQAAFSRSFKAVFGIMPGKFRKKGLQPYLSNKINITGKKLQHRMHQVSLQPEVVYIDKPLTIIGIKGKTSIKNNNIPNLWNELTRRWNEIENPSNPNVCYGISVVTDVQMPYDFMETTEYFEVVGTEVQNDSKLPVGMVKHQILPGYYAVFQHQGLANEIIDTYQYILGTWIYHCDYELDERDNFEIYGADYHGPENVASIARIYIAIHKPSEEI